MYLKEQYPVTAHVPNFDFWTGCREIKRCEESKRTLKNPFASRLAEFNTTLKLLRITDQWYIVPVKFRFGQNLDFLALLLLPLAGGPKNWKYYDADWRLISSASFHTSSDNCERNTQKWNSNNEDYVRRNHWGIDVTEEILWRGASWSRMFCPDALVNFQMNLLRPTKSLKRPCRAVLYIKLLLRWPVSRKPTWTKQVHVSENYFKIQDVWIYQAPWWFVKSIVVRRSLCGR